MKPLPAQPLRHGLTLAAVILVLDQLSKQWIVGSVMNPPQVIEVLPFFNLVMVWNRGVSFGMFASDSAENAYFLIAVALLITVGLLIWLRKAHSRLMVVGIGLVVGGAIGNIIDRVRWGAVADFLDLHVAGWHWPAFNIADSGITIGAVLLIWDSLSDARERPKTEPEPSQTPKGES